MKKISNEMNKRVNENNIMNKIKSHQKLTKQKQMNQNVHNNQQHEIK